MRSEVFLFRSMHNLDIPQMIKHIASLASFIMNLILLFTLALSSEAFLQQPRTTRLSRPFQLAFSGSDYAHAVDALAHELTKAHEGLKKIEILAARLKEMEAHDPHIADMKEGDTLKHAVAEAKAAIELYGTSSPEARVAFRQVDKVAEGALEEIHEDNKARYTETAIKHHHSYNNIIDSELLQESMEAVEQILALEHFAKIEQKRLDKDGRQRPGLQDRTPGVPWLSP